MRYTVFIRKGHGQYVAVAPLLPACSARGQTREEALHNLQKIIERSLTDMEITTVEVSGPMPSVASNVWLETAGMFKDDPLFDEMLAEVAAYRQAVDEQRD
jgi:predicted RNase H-like HicB family nuclease